MLCDIKKEKLFHPTFKIAENGWFNNPIKNNLSGAFSIKENQIKKS